uniref:NELL2-interacting cell ontogeny regulator 1 n=1 Tax=Panthera tigris altaica TaxID=74533 RepID=A0A8C9K6N4_PANTA
MGFSLFLSLSAPPLLKLSLSLSKRRASPLFPAPLPRSGARATPWVGGARGHVLAALMRRPCVDCHAFEFMQRALQDLRKTAYSLDSRTETLLLQAERRALCACWPAGR